MAVALQQFSYRLRVDTNAAQGGTPGWMTGQNSNPASFVNGLVRIRFCIENTGSTSSASTPKEIYVSRNGGAYAPVTTTTNYVQSADGTAGASADNSAITSALLTGASGTFVNGQYDDTGETAAQSIGATSYTEFEFGLNLITSAILLGDTYSFRVYDNNVALPTYTNTPTITITTGQLFPAASLASQSAGIGVAPFYNMSASAITASRPRVASQPTFTATNGAFQANGIASAAAGIGQPVFNQNDILTANLIASNAAGLGISAFNQTQVLTAVSIASQSDNLGKPILSITYIFNATSLSTGSDTFSHPIINQTHVLGASSLSSSADSLGNPSIQQGPVAISLVTGNSSLGQPAFNQTDILTAISIASSAANLGNPGSGYQLSPNNIATSAAGIGQSSLATSYSFTALSIASAGIGFGAPHLQQNPVASSITSSSIGLGKPAISLIYNLTSNSIASGPVAIGHPVWGDIFSGISIAASHPNAVAPTFTIQVGTPLFASNISSQSAGIGQPVFNQLDKFNGVFILTNAANLTQPLLVTNYTFSATGIASQPDGLGSSLVQQNPIALSLASSPASIGSPIFNGTISLTAISIATQPAAFVQLFPSILSTFTYFTSSPVTDVSPTLTPWPMLVAQNIVSGSAGIDAPTFTQNNVLTVLNLATGSVGIGSTAFNQNAILEATALASGAAGIGTPTIYQTQVLTATSLATGQVSLGTPILTPPGVIIAVPVISSGAGLGQPTFKQTNILSATSITSVGASIDQGSFNQIDVFAPISIVSVISGIGQPTFNQNNIFLGTSIASVSAGIISPTFNQIQNMSAVSIATQSSVIGISTYSGTAELLAMSISSDAAGIDKPIYLRNVGAVSIASASAFLGTPVFTQQQAFQVGVTFNTLGIATQPAFLGAPNIASSIPDAVPITTQAASFDQPVLFEFNQIFGIDLATQSAGLICTANLKQRSSNICQVKKGKSLVFDRRFYRELEEVELPPAMIANLVNQGFVTRGFIDP